MLRSSFYIALAFAYCRTKAIKMCAICQLSYFFIRLKKCIFVKLKKHYRNRRIYE
ncbi:hypothetical protein C7377_0978 [Balneicella halophila]|uniref:Uncharacterized protein n=1 Tax=Balneicella halophila TaxID=1537566 RepID=A0A7L4US87_BALHA|nr:hypothetical protein C7377_0978 [Balneicella halophila]